MRLRNILIQLRLTEKEKKIIDAKASRAQLPREQYLRACALNKTVSVIEDLRPMVGELKRIGNNVNQLATLAHKGVISVVDLHRNRDGPRPDIRGHAGADQG